ncbi:amidohydrolase family protein [bacterium]|nr:amidohydrolase family protein [bacterium]
MDNKVGSLEPGKYADLVILSGNPRTTNPANIRSIQVLQTYLGGQRKR